MAINVGAARDGEPVCEINTTPLIDVMLVLLVMLIITLPQQRHAVTVDTPVPCDYCRRDDPPSDVINVAIEGNGLILWNGAPVNRAGLRERLVAEAARSEQAELHIQASRFAKYGVVAHVMATAQRLGVKRIGITGSGIRA